MKQLLGKLKEKFLLNKRYTFELNDLVVLLDIIALMVCIVSRNPISNWVFLVAALIGFINALRGNRLNLIVLNSCFVILDLFLILAQLIITI